MVIVAAAAAATAAAAAADGITDDEATVDGIAFACG